MKQKTTTLLSLGASAILIAFGIWFLCSRNSWIWPEIGPWGMAHLGMMGGGMGIIMNIFWIVLIGAFALLISGAVNGFRGSRSDDGNLSSPLGILKRRYAQGEIDKAEYEAKRSDLNI